MAFFSGQSWAHAIYTASQGPTAHEDVASTSKPQKHLKTGEDEELGGLLKRSPRLLIMSCYAAVCTQLVIPGSVHTWVIIESVWSYLAAR